MLSKSRPAGAGRKMLDLRRARVQLVIGFARALGVEVDLNRWPR